MTRAAASSALLLTGLLALTACDAGGPDDEVVGTWSLASFTNREVMTVSRTQSVIDLTAPAAGAATLDGSETATLSTVNYVGRYGAGLDFWVASFDWYTSPVPARRHFLNVTDTGTPGWARAVAEADQDWVEYTTPEGGAAPFTRDGATYRFTGGRLAATDSSERAVTVGGAITFGTRTLTAGQAETISEYTYDADPYYRVRYAFEPGGTFRVEESQGNRTVERVGTWERTGTRLRLSTPTGVEGVTETLTYTVARTGGALVLTDDAGASSCDAACRQYMEQAWGLEPGTLRSYATLAEVRFVSVAPRANLQTDAAAPPRPVPAPMRDRLLVRRPAR